MTALAARPPGPRDARHHAGHLAVVCVIAAMGAVPACRRVDPPPPVAGDGARIIVAIPGTDVPVAPLLFNLTRARLIGMDQSGRDQPALFERWTTSADQRTWTLTVRDGVRQHDGQLATAADIVVRIREAIEEDDRPPGLWPVTVVETAGPGEVRLRLREPSSLLLEALSLSQIPAGPFQTPDADAAEPELHAVAQPGQDAGDIRQIKVQRYGTPRAAVAALLRDEVDVLYEVPSDDRALLAAEDGVHLFSNLKPYVVTLSLNHRHPVLSRRDVRLAMNAAIDREALVTQVAGGVGIPAADIIWHQHWSRPHGDDAAAIRVDRARAGRMLDEAGLPRRTGPGGVVEPRFRISCLVLKDPVMQRVAGRLRQAYADIGISLDLQVLPQDELVARSSIGQFDALVSPVVSGYGLGMPYVQFGAHDHPRIIDDGYKAAAGSVERVRAALTDEAFAAAVRDLHRVLIADPPAIYLFWPETSRATGRRVAVPADSTGDVLGSLARWRVRSQRR